MVLEDVGLAALEDDDVAVVGDQHRAVGPVEHVGPRPLGPDQEGFRIDGPVPGKYYLGNR